MSKHMKTNKLTCILLVAIYILSIALSAMLTSVQQRAKYEMKIEEINATHEEAMMALRDELQEEYDARITDLETYYEYGGDITQIELEAEYIAKVLYGMARNHAEPDRRAVIWCILNRVEHYSHPSTIIEVCEQPKQWMGYSSDNPVLEDLYELALSELKTWNSGGHRPMSNEYVYLSWSSKEILLRDTFEEGKHTHYWRTE